LTDVVKCYLCHCYLDTPAAAIEGGEIVRYAMPCPKCCPEKGGESRE